MSMFHELMMRKKEQIMYATIKGTLTENDGVFSGFSASNYLAIQEPFALTPTTKAEFVFRVSNTTFDGSSSFLGMIGSYSINFRFNTAKKLALYLGNGSSWVVNGLEGTTVFQENNFYYAKLVFDNGVITIYSSTDGKIWTQEATTTVSFTYTYNLLIGRANNDSSYQKGSIDLNNSYIKLGSTKYNLQAVVGYTIVGSPTITDGVVSGFSTSDYLRTSKLPILSEDFEMQFKIRINNTSISNALLGWVSSGYANYFSFSTSGKIQVSFRVSSSVYYNINGNFVFSTNTDYWVKYSKKGNTFYLYYSTDGVNWFLDNSATFEETISFSVSNYFRIGVNGFNNPSSYFNGSIDLNNTYIKINNKLWFNGQEG